MFGRKRYLITDQEIKFLLALDPSLPPDAFMLLGAERWRDGVKEQHVAAYRDGKVIVRWFPVALLPAKVFEEP